MKRDNISHEELIALLEYTPETGIFIWKETRGKAKKGRVAGTTDKDGYTLIMINSKQYKAHRLAWFYCFKEWPDNMLDHINRITNDNSLDNLREASSQENQRNRSINRNNTTGVRGVSLNKRTGKYEAYIKVNYVNKHLGQYMTLEEAATARNQAAKQEFGEFSHV